MRTALTLALMLWVSAAAAQTTPPQSTPAPDHRCSPEARRAAPGANPGTDLSERLADSRGVICPPGVDPGMTQPPPAGGALKVVPPPGSPGGDPQVQPK
jgi:hypothetical protein